MQFLYWHSLGSSSTKIIFLATVKLFFLSILASNVKYNSLFHQTTGKDSNFHQLKDLIACWYSEDFLLKWIQYSELQIKNIIRWTVILNWWLNRKDFWRSEDFLHFKTLLTWTLIRSLFKRLHFDTNYRGVIERWNKVVKIAANFELKFDTEFLSLSCIYFER